MATIMYDAVLQLHRGTKAAWEKNNPILAKSEPGHESDTGRLKIGDGVTPWNELDYFDVEEVFNAPTFYGFPETGSPNVIYKAEEERKIYQWSSSKNKYELISCGDIDSLLNRVKTTEADVLVLQRTVGVAAKPESSEGAGDATEATGLFKTIDDESARATAAETELGERIDKITHPVNGVSDTNPILALDQDKLISATISLRYNTDDKQIELIGKNGAIVSFIDATAFIKDGMLNDIDYYPETNTLSFKWNTDAGISETSVVLSDIIDPYISGEGIAVNGNTISVKIAEDSEPFVVADENGVRLSGILQAINTAKSNTIDEINEQLAGYIKKTDANGYGDILTKKEASKTYRTKKEYYMSRIYSDTQRFNDPAGYEVRIDLPFATIPFDKAGQYKIRFSKLDGQFAYVSEVFMNCLTNSDHNIRLQVDSYSDAYCAITGENTLPMDGFNNNPNNTLFRVGDWMEYDIEIPVDGEGYEVGLRIGVESGSDQTVRITVYNSCPGADALQPCPYGNNIEVDSELNAESENPVQNKAIYEKFEEINTFFENPQFGATVKVVGGKSKEDAGLVGVYRDFKSFSVSSRKFAVFDYNDFLATEKLVNGKPLMVGTYVGSELQLDALENQYVATDRILEDYNANSDKYYNDAEHNSLRRDVLLYYPLKSGQIAVIENDDILRAPTFEGDYFIFKNDGGAEGTYNRMYQTFWKLNKLDTIDAPNTVASFKSVMITGGENKSNTGLVQVDRTFSNYGASARKFAAYDYNSFFTTDKLGNGKPLRVCTNVWTELQLDAYSNNNTATDKIIQDYTNNTDKYYDNGDCTRRDISIYYPMKDGQVAIIEHGGVLRAANFEGENVTTGVTRTGWVIFENDDAKNGSPNRMFNEYWDLHKIGHISAPIADVTFKNLYSQTVKTPWVIFDNDGGTATTYNRLYNDWWKLNKVTSIDAPIADANFKSVRVNGKDIVQAVLAQLPIYNGGVE